MPDITIVKLKIRRGTDAQRQSVVLEQGELGYTIDTQRVFAGNGVTLGGTVVGNVVHPPLQVTNGRLLQTNAVKGDLVYENSVLWQLSGNSYANTADWANISPKGDETYITSNGSNQLTIKNSSITPNKLASTIVFNQGGINTNASGLSANVDGTYLGIISNKISLKPNSVDQTAIKSTALGRGLQGGNGTVLSFFGSSIFAYNGNEVTLSALPAEVVTVQSLSSDFVGSGLQIRGNSLTTTITSYDTNSFYVDMNTLRLNGIIVAGSTNFSNVDYNAFGQISAVRDGVFHTLSGRNSLTSRASAAAIFNGHYDQTVFSNQTILTAMSSNPDESSSVTTALTSAGFMSISTSLGVVAIPIFKYNP